MTQNSSAARTFHGGATLGGLDDEPTVGINVVGADVPSVLRSIMLIFFSVSNDIQLESGSGYFSRCRGTMIREKYRMLAKI